MKSRIMGELKKVFRPELLNRIDEVIVFHKLAKEEIGVIVDLMMRRLREQMKEHEVSIELSQDAVELLAEKGYDPTMGARPLRRTIQNLIEDPLADFVLGRHAPGRRDDRDRSQGGRRRGRQPDEARRGRSRRRAGGDRRREPGAGRGRRRDRRVTTARATSSKPERLSDTVDDDVLEGPEHVRPLGSFSGSHWPFCDRRFNASARRYKIS